MVDRAAALLVSPMRLLMLLAALPASPLAVLSPARSMPPPLLWTGPTGQPPTEAQDEQRCGMLLLPPRIRLVALPPERTKRVGRWETLDSATLATWEQDYFSFAPMNLYFSRGNMLLFQLMDLGNNTISFEDCEGARMYTVQQVEGGCDITDNRGQLVARGRRGVSDYFPGQMLFQDPQGEPIAVAETENPSTAQPPQWGDWRSFGSEEPDSAAGGRAPPAVLWQVHFYGASSTNSSLMHAQRRWVVTALTQEIVVREDVFGIDPRYLRPWLIAAWLLVATLALLGFFYLLWYRLLVPAQRRGMDERYPVRYDEEERDYGGLRGRLPAKAAAASPASAAA